MIMKSKTFLILPFVLITAISCSKKDDDTGPEPLDPDTAPEVEVDRFSSTAGHLFVRDANNGFPGPNAPVDFDAIPAFITMGLGPGGEMVEYYNFDVMSTTPAPIWVLFKDGEDTPVGGQLNIINVLPGDPGYNDFWLVHKVTVPSNYVSNTVTSYAGIIDAGYSIMPLTAIVNCPVVPKGSTASKRYLSSESTALTRGWYNDKVVYYFNFSEKELVSDGGKVPTSDIFVAFNINPGIDGGGPPSGFKTEDGTSTGQTHNVPETLPEDASYSPLWDVNIYDNTHFDQVMDLTTAGMATILAMDAAIVNCPVVSVQ
jgi:hypothetical protein